METLVIRIGIREFTMTQSVGLYLEQCLADCQFPLNFVIAMTMAERFGTMLVVSWLNMGEENRDDDIQSERFQARIVLQ
jgi:hypothetical protein